MEAFHQAKAGQITQVFMVMRRPSGALQACFSGMTRSEVAEHVARAQNLLNEMMGADSAIDAAMDVQVEEE